MPPRKPIPTAKTLPSTGETVLCLDDIDDPDELRLTMRKRTFAEQYVELSLRLGREHGVGVAAFKRAFPMAQHSAQSIYHKIDKLMKDPGVRQFIEIARTQKRERNAATADRVIQELENIAFAQTNDVFQTDPKTGKITVDLANLDPASAAAIASIQLEDLKGGGQRATVKMYDKNAALNTLGRILGVDKNNVELTIPMLDKLIAKMRSDMGLPPELPEDGEA